MTDTSLWVDHDLVVCHNGMTRRTVGHNGIGTWVKGTLECAIGDAIVLDSSREATHRGIYNFIVLDLGRAHTDATNIETRRA
jgi:hypothetical protein